MIAQEDYPKFVQIISHDKHLVAVDADGMIWFYITAYEMHTGERITSHWAPITSMERRP